MQSILKIGLAILLICFLSTNTYPSTNKTQTYVSRSSLTSSPQHEYSGLLFAQQMEDSIKVERTDSMKLKDPKMAVFYAIIPGIVVHGSGHFYAGKTKTGFLLLGAEAAGGLLMFTALGFAIRGPAYEHQLETDLLAWTGAMLFGGSWIYDVIGSPIAVKKENQKLLGRKSANLKFEFDHKYDSIKIVLIGQF